MALLAVAQTCLGWHDARHRSLGPDLFTDGERRGPFMGHPLTGRKCRWTGIAVYRFNDEGLIDGRWQEFDGVGLFTQLGLIPPIGPGGG